MIVNWKVIAAFIGIAIFIGFSIFLSTFIVSLLTIGEYAQYRPKADMLIRNIPVIPKLNP